MSETELIVSRETHDKLKRFQKLFLKWNRKINLISHSTIAEFENRHIQDSFEIIQAAGQQPGHWLDLGTGGGFPGLIVAILKSDMHWLTKVTMIESDARKSAFLRTVVRELDLEAVIITSRIEQEQTQHANIVSSRALAALPQLLDYGIHHMAKDCVFVFPKGEGWEAEVATARRLFQFDLEVKYSETRVGSVNLVVRNPKRAK